MKSLTIHNLCLRLTFTATVFSVIVSQVGTQETAPTPLPEAQVREVTSRILQNANKANCKPQECRILIANFTFGSGLTSQLGIQLADQFSEEFTSQQNEIQMVDRSALRAYLEQERIPGALLNNEKAMRWLGKQLGGTAVLTGLIDEKGSALRVKIRLLSCDKDKARLEDELTLSPLSNFKDTLTGVEAFPQKPPSVPKPIDSPTFRAGVAGVTQPGCNYCPDPSYTKAGRDAEFQGVVLMDVTLSAEGRAADVRIVQGIPYGLNQAAISAVQSWKFKPATHEGRPVPVKVMVEITFRCCP